MLPYITVFFLSTLLLAFSDRVKKNQGRFIVAVALILPAMLAAFRADNIGTDTDVYLNPIINAAIDSSSFSEYLDFGWFREWRYLFVRDFELGFTSVVYAIANIFGAKWTKLVLEILIIFPIYLSVKKYKKYPIWLGMLVFYLTIYNSSLNMIRQSVTVSFVLLGIVYLLEERKKGFITCLLVAISFHKTGFILLPIAAIYYFIRLGIIKLWGLAIVSIGLLFSIDTVASVLKLVGYGDYLNYLNGEFHFLPNQFIYHFPVLLLIFLNWGKWNCNENNARFFMAILILMLICLQLRSVNMYLGRTASFFFCFAVIIYPSICYSFYNKSNRFLAIGYLVIYLGIYWWQYYVVNGIDDTVPYMMLSGE